MVRTPYKPGSLLRFSEARRVTLQWFPNYDMNCIECQRDEMETTLNKCPSCFKLICVDCGTQAMGRVFCTKRCAEEFFWGDDDE